MALIRKSLRPLARAAQLFFRYQLRLRVRGGLRLEWAEPGGSARPSAESVRRTREQAEADQIVQQLAALLNEDADIRHSLRHLSFLEQSLQERGLAALSDIPLDVLRRALDQFEGLVTNWEPRGLASLRSRMSVELTRRQDHDEAPAVHFAAQASEPPKGQAARSRRESAREVTPAAF